MFYIAASKGVEMADPTENNLVDDDDAFYTLVPEQGLCLVGDVILNLRRINIIRRLEGKTLVYHSGAAEPVILPLRAFEQIRDAVFTVDDLDDDEELDDDED